MASLEGTVAIVTGAGRGMGRTHALALAEAGAAVVVNDLASGGSSPAADVVGEIEAAGGRAVASEESVADWDGAARMVQRALDAFGRLDVLVNNAGILRDRVLVNLSEEEWSSVLAVHLTGTFAPLRHAAAHWRERSKVGEQVRAAVVNTTSPAGLHGNPGQANYGAAKAGVVGLTLTAALELGRYGVRVNAICPSARTRMTENLPGFEDVFAAPEDPAAFDTWAPENVSPMVVFLSEPDCTVTGQVFGIQGDEAAQYRGWTIERKWKAGRRWSVEELRKRFGDVPELARGVGMFEEGS